MGSRADRPLWRVAALVAMAALGGCKKDDKTEPKPEATAVKPAEITEAKRPDKPAPVDESSITWIKDDYDRAIAEAKKAGKPLVIDMWAPWCHTCLSMKHYVLIDKTFADYADRFVWLALDTDREKNAAPVAKFPPAAWPTFFVVDADEQVAARFVGAATVGQFRDFLATGERAIREGAELAEGSPSWHMREGDRHASAKRHAKAAASYARALEAAPADWPRRPDILVSQIGSLFKAGDKKACAELGARIGETTAARSASTADFAYYASTCAPALPEQEARALRAKLLAALLPILEDETSHLSVDDRSDGWRIAREIYLEDGKEPEAARAAETQLAILDAAAKSAHTPYAAMTYNWPRAEVYVFLGRATELVDDLEKSAAALPEEYDPPYRLAWVQLKLGRHDKALANAKRAVELVYGPRKARALSLVADIHEAAGDKDKAREVREQVLAHVQSLPEGQRSESLIAWAKKALEPDKKDAH